MTSKRWIRSAVGIAAIAVAAVGVMPPTLPGAPSVSAAEGPGAGGEFHTTSGDRVFDSRNGIGDPSPGLKPTGGEVHVDVLGKAGVPSNPDEVLAVAANVTITGHNRSGYGEVYPKGFRPADPASLVNFKAGADVSNMVIVGVGNDGAITFLPITPGAADGSVHVLIDVFGWISKTGYEDTSDTGSRLISLDAPVRFLDQRPLGTTVGAGETVSIDVRGAGGIPNSEDVTGVVINLTADNNQPAFVHQNTFISATAEPLDPGVIPSTSTANVRKGLIKSNLAFVPVGADGSISFYNSAGDVQLIVDVFGYMEVGRDASTYIGRIIPLEFPFRAFDTRQPEYGSVPLGFGGLEDWSFWCFADSITVNGQPVNRQSALLGNVTGTQFDRLQPNLPNDTFLTLFPRVSAPATPPSTSNINIYPNTDVPNMALLTYGNSTLRERRRLSTRTWSRRTTTTAACTTSSTCSPSCCPTTPAPSCRTTAATRPDDTTRPSTAGARPQPVEWAHESPG